MCCRGLSQIFEIVLVMLILLSGKDPKRYQLGLW